MWEWWGRRERSGPWAERAGAWEQRRFPMRRISSAVTASTRDIMWARDCRFPNVEYCRARSSKRTNRDSNWVRTLFLSIFFARSSSSFLTGSSLRRRSSRRKSSIKPSTSFGLQAPEIPSNDVFRWIETKASAASCGLEINGVRSSLSGERRNLRKELQ